MVPQQIGWLSLPQLSARLLAIDATLQFAPDVSSVLQDASVALGLKAYFSALDVVTPPPQSSGAELDQYFLELAQMLRPRFSAGAPNTWAGRLGTGILQRLQSPPCATCRARSPCTSAEDDALENDARIANGGQCLRMVHELFGFAIKLTERIYRKQSGKYPAVLLGTSTLEEPNQNSGMALSARTREGGRQNGANRIVDILFCVDRFTFGDYRHLLYALVHECVAHAHCGIRLDSPDAAASETFHEGWMDYVAFATVARALETSDPDLPAIVLQDSIDFRQAMQDSHSRRIAYTLRDAPASASVNCFGAQTAQGFFRFCESVFGNSQLAFDVAVSFSASVNASALDDVIRGQIVSAARNLFHGSQRLVNSLGDRTLTEPLHAFAKSGDFMPLVERLNSSRT